MLLKTKFTKPAQPTSLIKRDHLLPVFSQALEHQLTLVYAPAGYGKTTATLQWLTRVENNTQQLWVKLDKRDNNPIKFWQSLYSGFTQIGTESSTWIESSLENPGQKTVEGIVDHLLKALTDNESDQSPTTIIVLDDFHLITQADIIDSFEYFLDYLPKYIHFVITSRTVPSLHIPQRKLSGSLIEIGPQQLVLNLTETQQLIHQVGTDHNTQEMAKAIYKNTGGWVASVKLASLALANANLSPNDIAAALNNNQDLNSYFVNEILDCQPASIREFLLLTALVPKFNIELCQYFDVFNKPIIDLIDQIANAGFFLTNIERENTWFYYHDVFRQLLVKRQTSLDSALTKKVIDKSIQWFELNGYIEEAAELAVTHNNWKTTVALLEKALRTLPLSGDRVIWQKIIDKIPAPVIEQSAPLLFFQLWSRLLTGSTKELLRGLDDCERLIEKSRESIEQFSESELSSTDNIAHLGMTSASKRNALLANVLIYQVHLLHGLGDINKAEVLLEQALGLNVKLDPSQLAFIYLGSGFIAFLHGKLSKAESLFQQSLNIGLETFNPQILFSGTSSIAMTFSHQGDIDKAIAVIKATDLRFTEAKLESSPLGILNRFSYWYPYMEKGEFDQLRDVIESTQKSIEKNGETIPDQRLYLFHALLRYNILIENWGKAYEALNAIENLVAHSNSAFQVHGSTKALKAHLDLRSGKVVEATRWAESQKHHLFNSYQFDQDTDQFIFCEILVNTMQDDLPHHHLQLLEQHLERLKQINIERQCKNKEIIVLTFLAIIASRREDHTQALAHARSAIEQASAGSRPVLLFLQAGPEFAALLSELKAAGIEKEFIDHIDKKKSRLADFRAANTKPISISLSDKESLILSLIQSGKSNQAIADDLCRGITTVKWHIKNIYKKIGVKNRAEAASAAGKWLDNA